eukprot:10945684-Ditylum_brightwellii.AAC.1
MGVPVERYPASWVIRGSEPVLRNSDGSAGCPWRCVQAGWRAEVHLVGRGKGVRCSGASVGNLAVLGARA